MTIRPVAAAPPVLPCRKIVVSVIIAGTHFYFYVFMVCSIYIYVMNMYVVVVDVMINIFMY